MGENYYTDGNLLGQTSNFNRFITFTLDLSNSINRKKPQKNISLCCFLPKNNLGSTKTKNEAFEKMTQKETVNLGLEKTAVFFSLADFQM